MLRIYVSLREIVTHVQEGPTGVPGGRVTQAITEIEPGGVAAFAVADEGIGGQLEVVLPKGNKADIKLGKKLIDDLARIGSSTG